MALTNFPGGFCHRLYEAYSSDLKDKAQASKFLSLACTQGYKLQCACKTDADCGAPPKEVAGDSYSCQSGRCEMDSPH